MKNATPILCLIIGAVILAKMPTQANSQAPKALVAVEEPPYFPPAPFDPPEDDIGEEDEDICTPPAPEPEFASEYLDLSKKISAIVPNLRCDGSIDCACGCDKLEARLEKDEAAIRETIDDVTAINSTILGWEIEFKKLQDRVDKIDRPIVKSEVPMEAVASSQPKPQPKPMPLGTFSKPHWTFPGDSITAHLKDVNHQKSIEGINLDAMTIEQQLTLHDELHEAERSGKSAPAYSVTVSQPAPTVTYSSPMTFSTPMAVGSCPNGRCPQANSVQYSAPQFRPFQRVFGRR